MTRWLRHLQSHEKSVHSARVIRNWLCHYPLFSRPLRLMLCFKLIIQPYQMATYLGGRIGIREVLCFSQCILTVPKSWTIKRSMLISFLIKVSF